MGAVGEEPRRLALIAHVPDVESRGGRLRKTRTIRIDDLEIRRMSWTECVAVRRLSLHLYSSRPPKVLMTAVPTILSLTNIWNNQADGRRSRARSPVTLVRSAQTCTKPILSASHYSGHGHRLMLYRNYTYRSFVRPL